jgi:hypothetical protein
MVKTCMFLVGALILALLLPLIATGQSSAKPETAVVQDGSITLHALLWRPQGRGPFPAILCNHGSGRRLKHWDRCSRGMGMSFCFFFGRALGRPPIRVRVPST